MKNFILYFQMIREWVGKLDSKRLLIFVLLSWILIHCAKCYHSADYSSSTIFMMIPIMVYLVINYQILINNPSLTKKKQLHLRLVKALFVAIILLPNFQTLVEHYPNIEYSEAFSLVADVLFIAFTEVMLAYFTSD